MIEPFEKWALDFVGRISPMSRKKKYILVCTDYVTKWVEAKYLHLRATEKSVVEFIYEKYSLSLVCLDIRGNLGPKMGLIRKRAKISFCELEFKNQ